MHLRHDNPAQARAAFEQAISIFAARGLPDTAAIVQKALDALPPDSAIWRDTEYAIRTRKKGATL